MVASSQICVAFYANSLGMFLGCMFSEVRQVVSIVPV